MMRSKMCVLKFIDAILVKGFQYTVLNTGLRNLEIRLFQPTDRIPNPISWQGLKLMARLDQLDLQKEDLRPCWSRMRSSKAW